MIFYQLGCGLFVHLVAALPLDAVTQPPSPTVHCQQLYLVPRPKGEADLVCNVSGVRMNDGMTFYWWLHVTPTNIQTPIYSYSDTFNVDDITSTYRDMFVNETHVISERHMTSEIKLLINMTTNGVLKFEITMASQATYTEAVEISFEDPQIIINLEEMPKNYAHGPNSTINLTATCYVDACFGKPTMSISCNDIEGDNEIVFDGQFDERDPADHFSAIRRAVIKTKNCGQINCSVTDERGTYHATRNITLFDNTMPTAPGPLSGYRYKTILICSIVGSVALYMVTGPIYAYICIRCQRADIETRQSVHNRNETEHEHQPMITSPSGYSNSRENFTSI